MNQICRTSVAAGRLAVGLARIKSTPYLVSPLMRTGYFVTSRSFVNGRVSGFPVGNQLEMAETGGKKEIDFASIFTKKVSTEEMTDDHHHDKELSFDSVFTGEVEKKYLHYLANLDCGSLHHHVSNFPRKRSEKEKKLIFDKYVACYERKYPSDEVKKKRYGYFKENLDYIDESNTRSKGVCKLGLVVCMDLFTPGKTWDFPKDGLEYDPFEKMTSAVPCYMLDDLLPK